MKVIRPTADIVDVHNREAGVRLLQLCEKAARISHRSEDAQTGDSWERFLRSVVMGHGDFSVIEHRSFTVEFVVDRGISHELVRHRLFAYTQESTRFVNYEKKMPPSFIYPIPGVECQWCLNGYTAARLRSGSELSRQYFHREIGQICMYSSAWLDSIRTAEESYKSLLLEGWKPQDARSVFPNALATKLWVSGNLRNWRHVLLMRTTAEAHPQMRQVMIPLLNQCQERIPMLFDDIVPNARQIENMRKPR